MKKMFLVLTSTMLLGGCNPKDLFIKPPAGLDIMTSPGSTVFINGENKGNTPFSDKAMKPGVYTLKLVPTDTSLLPYETSLNLSSHASSVISRNLATTELDGSGYTLELQPDNASETYLSIISEPDTINVTIDGKPSGFTPLSKMTTTPGTHALLVTSPGFIEQQLSVNTAKGYNLIVSLKLGTQAITLSQATTATSSSEIISSPLPSPTTPNTATKSATKIVEKPYILIEETGTGWLRVRKDPSGTADELGKANTGEKLPYLGESTEIGWFKVQFEGSNGWVSGKYVTLVK